MMARDLYPYADPDDDRPIAAHAACDPTGVLERMEDESEDWECDEDDVDFDDDYDDDDDWDDEDDLIDEDDDFEDDDFEDDDFEDDDFEDDEE